MGRPPVIPAEKKIRIVVEQPPMKLRAPGREGRRRLIGDGQAPSSKRRMMVRKRCSPYPSAAGALGTQSKIL